MLTAKADNMILNGPYIFWYMNTTQIPSEDKYINVDNKILDKDAGYPYTINEKYNYTLCLTDTGPFVLYESGIYNGKYYNYIIHWPDSTELNLQCTFPVKIYSMTVGKGTFVEHNIQYSLRPCLYNGEYGLWDTISNTFYGNSGAGTITGGFD